MLCDDTQYKLFHNLTGYCGQANWPVITVLDIYFFKVKKIHLYIPLKYYFIVTYEDGKSARFHKVSETDEVNLLFWTNTNFSLYFVKLFRLPVAVLE